MYVCECVCTKRNVRRLGAFRGQMCVGSSRIVRTTSLFTKSNDVGGIVRGIIGTDNTRSTGFGPFRWGFVNGITVEIKVPTTYAITHTAFIMFGNRCRHFTANSFPNDFPVSPRRYPQHSSLIDSSITFSVRYITSHKYTRFSQRTFQGSI